MCFLRISFFTLLIIFNQSFAQDEGFRLKEEKKTTIPFQFINNLIFVPITINGVELTFLLDTGVSETIIFSLDNKEIQLSDVSKTKFSGLGGQKSIDGLKSDNNDAVIAKNFVNKTLSLYIIIDEEFNISPYVGIPVNGIMGYDFFKNHIIEIDYIKKKINVLTEKDLSASKLKKFTSFDISVEKDKPYIYGDIQMTREKKSSKLLIDTGNSDPIWIFPSLIKNFVYNRPNIEDFLGRGFNGDIHGKKSRIHSFHLKNFNFQTPYASMPDEYSIQHAYMVKDRKGSIGSEILRRFYMIIDYPNQKLYLRKNKYYSDHFHLNMSGLDFKQTGMQWESDVLNFNKGPDNTSTSSNITFSNTFQYKFTLKPVFAIAGVRNDSPGGKAGLMKDDELVSINGVQTTNMTLHKIIDLMRSNQGKNIKMKVLRNKKEMIFQFFLEDPIPYQEHEN